MGHSPDTCLHAVVLKAPRTSAEGGDQRYHPLTVYFGLTVASLQGNLLLLLGSGQTQWPTDWSVRCSRPRSGSRTGCGHSAAALQSPAPTAHAAALPAAAVRSCPPTCGSAMQQSSGWWHDMTSGQVQSAPYHLGVTAWSFQEPEHVCNWSRKESRYLLPSCCMFGHHTACQQHHTSDRDGAVPWSVDRADESKQPEGGWLTHLQGPEAEPGAAHSQHAQQPQRGGSGAGRRPCRSRQRQPNQAGQGAAEGLCAASAVGFRPVVSSMHIINFHAQPCLEIKYCHHIVVWFGGRRTEQASA